MISNTSKKEIYLRFISAEIIGVKKDDLLLQVCFYRVSGQTVNIDLNSF